MSAFHRFELAVFVAACLATIASLIGMEVSLATRGEWPLFFLVGTLTFGAIALACVGPDEPRGR